MSAKAPLKNLQKVHDKRLQKLRKNATFGKKMVEARARKRRESAPLPGVVPIANGKQAPATEPRCLPSRAARPTSFQPVSFVLDQQDQQRTSATAAAGVVRRAAGAPAEAPAVKPHHAQLDLGKSFVDDAVFLPGVEDVMNTRCCDEKVMKVSRDVQRGVGGGMLSSSAVGAGGAGAQTGARGCPARKAKTVN